MKRFAMAAGLTLSFGIVAVACAGAPEEAAKDQVEVQELGFSVSSECSECALDALQGACQAEADACEADPDCLAVKDCLLACDPSDVACLTSCASANATFGALAECVLCDTCTADCAGIWACGGGGTGGGGGGTGGGGTGGGGGGGASTCDANGADCVTCLECAATNVCVDEVNQCLQEPACAQIAVCVQSCDTIECAQQCFFATPDGQATFLTLAECGVCDTCSNACDGQVLGCP